MRPSGDADRRLRELEAEGLERVEAKPSGGEMGSAKVPPPVAGRQGNSPAHSSHGSTETDTSMPSVSTEMRPRATSSSMTAR